MYELREIRVDGGTCRKCEKESSTIFEDSYEDSEGHRKLCPKCALKRMKMDLKTWNTYAESRRRGICKELGKELKDFKRIIAMAEACLIT